MKLGNTYIRFSLKNGLIIVRNVGNAWEVHAGGALQTSLRYADLWTDAFAHCPKLPQGSKEVLMLGLGGGGALPAVYGAYAPCRITAVEYDAEMIEIAKDLQLQALHPFPAVHEGDAAQVVPQLHGLFDIIIVDLFRGRTPSVLISNKSFLTILRERLAPGGFVIINTIGSTEYLSAAAEVFSMTATWTNEGNIFGAFSNPAR